MKNVIPQRKARISQVNGRPLVLILFALSFVPACRAPRVSENDVFRFTDRLEPRGILLSPFLSAPPLSPLSYPADSEPLAGRGVGDNPFGLKRNLDLGPVSLDILFAPPDSEYVYDVKLPPQARLEFGVGLIRDSNFEAGHLAIPAGEKVDFLVHLESGGRRTVVFNKTLRLPSRDEVRTVRFSQENLALPAAGRVRLSFTTKGKKNLFAFWFNPTLYKPRPEGINVVLVSIDTLRADHLGCYGYARETSPHLDAMAAESTLFLNAYAPSPWTLPSHVSLFTGLEPHNHQVYSSDERMSPSLETLADVLRQNGYFCGAVTGSGFLSPRYGFAKGFDTYSESEGQSSLPDSAARVEQAAAEWLVRHVDKRFFLFLHTYQPHSPYDSPGSYGTMFQGERTLWPKIDLNDYLGGGKLGIYNELPDEERQSIIALYDGEVRYVDDALIAPLADKLKSLGLYDRTLLVVTSDHGEEFYDHGGWGHGQSLYEELLRVPLLIKFPGGRFRGHRETRVARLMDIMPTILDVAGVPASGLNIDARTLRPLLSGKEDKPRIVVAESCWHLKNGCPPSSDAASSPRQPYQSTLVVGPEKLILTRPARPEDIEPYFHPPPATAPVELYDLAADPLERTNLAQAKAALAQRLWRQLNDIVGKASGPAVERIVLDERLIEQLRALGYIR